MVIRYLKPHCASENVPSRREHKNPADNGDGAKDEERNSEAKQRPPMQKAIVVG